MDHYPTEQYCGLIPVGKPVRAQTTGLRWNLNSDMLDFEDLVSTSNRTVDTIVNISCDGPLLWTVSNPYIKRLEDN